MSLSARSPRSWSTGRFASGVAAALLLVPAGSPQMTGPVRTLSGVVTDGGHEPIRGAVVELRDDRSNEVITYLTDGSGHYTFKRLDSGADYEVWVIFRGHRSPTHSISKFDSHLQKVIDFKVRTF